MKTKLLQRAKNAYQAVRPAMSLRTKLLTFALLVTVLLGSHFAVYRWASMKAQLTAEAVCKQAQIEGLVDAMNSFTELTLAANNASATLSNTISARLDADADTTMEIRNALAASASNRLECSFDDGIMRHLAAARARAAAAAAGGLDGAVPAAGADAERER